MRTDRVFATLSFLGALCLAWALQPGGSVPVAPDASPASPVVVASAEHRDGTRPSARASDRGGSALAADLAPVDAPHTSLAERLRRLADPQVELAAWLETLSRAELIGLLSGVTGRSEAQLEEIRDLHGFAVAMASAAASGVVTPERPSTPAAIVSFASTLHPTETDLGAHEFRTSEDRIFGVFPMESGARSSVIAKWLRVDSSELLLFEELPVVERDGRGFVSLAPEGGFPQGEYRVEILSPVEPFAVIASGSYTTRGTGRPPRMHMP